ncbi:bifunctional riboflavin kinase/FAD synthetase [Calothrix sp. PCC 6303]|uniref:bifunctional riboflavin kinase/FAD synthetase n=1 Tax=Calothrix sp. PCC 6303 TaxID=1170562 RepID=UPI0002A004C1|nr:bifunctional riboflavin kinase/FAD synthetase [Calothrix sp. PCC 6303]AFZ03140.1 riboflavin biosynthesis protein RibF [Calothrix sp. PCC 6303]
MLNLSQNGCSVWVTSSTELALTPNAIALGKFDGVHRGHQQVIQPIIKASGVEGTESHSTVVTFNPHPQEFFSGTPRALLTPLDEKVQKLRSLGVEQLILLPFDRELCALSPQEFVEKILINQLQATQISVGEDFCFGSQRSGTALDLQAIASKYNIPVTVSPLQTYDSTIPAEDTRISTSVIRQLLELGDIQRANRLLGYSYTLIGTVIQGKQIGRTIDFPTANLQLPSDKFLPRKGVYAVRVYQFIETSDTTQHIGFGVMNIGNRPTVNGVQTTTEVHLLDWSGDLYDQKLTIELQDFLRPERKFPSLADLKTQIQQDAQNAKTFFHI